MVLTPTSSASEIRASVQSGPSASALSSTRACMSFRAAPLPTFTIRSSIFRSSPVNLTTYFFAMLHLHHWPMPLMELSA